VDDVQLVHLLEPIESLENEGLEGRQRDVLILLLADFDVLFK
jgi:hypothetical protein